MMKKYLFPLFILLLFISNIQLIYGAACYPTCTPTPCPDLQAGTEISNIELNPDSSIFIEVDQRCKNPTGINTAEEWAGYFGVSANNGEDKDIRIDKYWEQEEPACACVLKTKDPAEIFDILYKKWEFCEPPIDLTNPGQYSLKHIWYNKVRKDQNNCVINYVDGEKNRIKVINVNEFETEIDPMPSQGTPVPWRDYKPCDCDHTYWFPGWYHDGTMKSDPLWEKRGVSHGNCDESLEAGIEFSANTTIGFQLGVKHYLYAIIGANWSETTSFFASSPCSRIENKRRSIACYQRGWRTVRNYKFGKCWWDDEKGEFIYQQTGITNPPVEDIIWKKEPLFNCATWAMTVPEFEQTVY